MDQDDFFKSLVGLGILNHAHEGRKPRSRGKQKQPLAGLEIIQHQGADGFLSNQNLVPHLDVLQPGRQRAVVHLDRQKLQMLLIVGTGDAVGAHERLAFHLEANHHEMAVAKPQTRITRCLEREQGLVPVMHFSDCFRVLTSHNHRLQGAPAPVCRLPSCPPRSWGWRLVFH